MKKTEIYSSKKKAVLFFFASAIFVALGIWMILDAENIKTPFLRNPLMIRIVGVVGVLLFGFGMWVTLKQLFRKKLMLIIDESGINLKPSDNRIIHWKDIEGFSEMKINSVKIIIIHIKNPEKYIDSEPNKIRKKLLNYNLNNYGSPFTITVSTMEIGYEELWKLLNESLIMSVD